MRIRNTSGKTTMETKHDETVKALETKLAQAKARQAKARAAARAAEAAAKRTADTRRKILRGACNEAEAEADASHNASQMSLLSRRLTRPDDRALFGLEPLPAPAGAEAAG